MDPYTFDLQRILIGDLPLLFLAEVALRTVVLYSYALLLFRIMGKRSVGQLTPLELVIVVGLGSAVGDPMFYPDVPILHGMLVITLVAIMQRALTYVKRRHPGIEDIIKGHPVRLVFDGLLDLSGMAEAQLSREEVFMELRERSYVNLGEVHSVYMEPNGTISYYQHDPEDVRPGLPLTPPWDIQPPVTFRQGTPAPEGAYYGCGFCGQPVEFAAGETLPGCPRCGKGPWVRATSAHSQ